MRTVSLNKCIITSALLAAITMGSAQAAQVVETGFNVTTFATGLSHNPRGIAVSPGGLGFVQGEVFVASRGEPNFAENDFITRINSAGNASLFAIVGATDPGAIDFGKGGFNTNLWIATNTGSASGLGDSHVYEVGSAGTIIGDRVTGGSGSGGIDFDTSGLYRNSMYVGITGLDGIGEVPLVGNIIIPVFSLFPGALCGGPVGIQFGLGNEFGSAMYMSVDSCNPPLTRSGVYRIAADGTATQLADTSTTALISTPGLDGLAFGKGGKFGTDLFLSDRVNGTILRITANGTTSVFANGLSSPSGIAFDGTRALYVVEAGTNSVTKISPNNTPVLSCVGFDAPMAAGVVSVRGNRALPLKAQLLNANQVPVTATAITAAPVLQVLYRSTAAAQPVDVTADALADGHSNEGNQFIYSDGRWRFNLKTRNYQARGSYDLIMTSGNDNEYMIQPFCVATFSVQ